LIGLVCLGKFPDTRAFVLGTDFEGSEGRGLNKFNRLLKAEAFFKSESNAETVTMEYKRDRETSWQPAQNAGGISIVDANKDYAVVEFYFDALARHFLFKFSATNTFQFYGVVLYFDPMYGRRFS